MCYILTFDRAVNQRCTCVNKRKQVGVMKEYRQMPAAVESIGDRKARVRASLHTENSPQRTPVEQPQLRCREALCGFLKITQRAMVKRRSCVNIAACPCLYSSLTHHSNINPFENKVWEIHIFIKKCVRSFIEVRKLYLIMFPLIFVLRLYNSCLVRLTLIVFLTCVPCLETLNNCLPLTELRPGN